MEVSSDCQEVVFVEAMAQLGSQNSGQQVLMIVSLLHTLYLHAITLSKLRLSLVK